MPRPYTALVLGILFVACGVADARADEDAIVADIVAFFRTSDTTRRQQLVARIQADPVYDRAKVGAWLHHADLFRPFTSGRQEIQVSLSDGSSRAVVLRIPKEYDRHKPWPLIYALHGAGGNGDQIAGYVHRILGDQVEKYVVAAPSGYQEVIIHGNKWPPNGEHPAVLRAVKSTVHVDSDRVYLMGYSLGGHTTWTLAVLHPDQFAAAMPLAGTFTLVFGDRLWEVFLPNLVHTPVLAVWGAGDTSYGGEGISPGGGIAGANRVLRDMAPGFKIPLVAIELPDADHYNVVPPADELEKLLAHTRVHYPKSFRQAFRHTYQAQAWWVECHQWAGSHWTDKKVTIRLREGENPLSDKDFDNAALRAFRGLLGEIRGEINGQQLDVYRRKIKELTVWIGDGMIDWEQPVVLKANGREVFEGRLEPDLFVCLSQAARTWDFDRLRWAGLRFRSGSKTRPVTPETGFPEVVGEAVVKKK